MSNDITPQSIAASLDQRLHEAMFDIVELRQRIAEAQLIILRNRPHIDGPARAVLEEISDALREIDPAALDADNRDTEREGGVQP